jgi:hypothetical protein
VDINSIKSIEDAKEEFREKTFASMKENLMMAIVAFLWNLSIEQLEASNRVAVHGNTNDEIRKKFIAGWKSSMSSVARKHLEEVNKELNEQNADMLNMINGEPLFTDIEDYQQIINSNIKEIENVFNTISGGRK